MIILYTTLAGIPVPGIELLSTEATLTSACVRFGTSARLGYHVFSVISGISEVHRSGFAFVRQSGLVEFRVSSFNSFTTEREISGVPLILRCDRVTTLDLINFIIKP
jgi:hypothetical protein